MLRNLCWYSTGCYTYTGKVHDASGNLFPPEVMSVQNPSVTYIWHLSQNKKDIGNFVQYMQGYDKTFMTVHTVMSVA